ncbi:MAG: peptidylprolyl isomerase [Actinomycetota bacterium]
MSKRKTRERQLAKLAARRAAERRHRRRRRILGGAVGGVAFLAVALVLVLALTGGNGKPSAAKTPTSPAASASPSPEASYSPGTGKQTGTVTPAPAPEQVACGAKAPPGAGKPKPQFSGPPPVTVDPANTYVATMETSCGTITFKLLASTAPLTVNSFVFLARHHYFDGQFFHRIDTSIDVLQGGDPKGTGTGGPGYTIPDELSGHDTYGPGTLAMANANDPSRGVANTGGSQFFIITGPNGHKLDSSPNYTVFGQILHGLDVAQRIQKLPIQSPAKVAKGDLSGQAPKMAVYIDKVTIQVTKPATIAPSPTPTSTKK